MNFIYSPLVTERVFMKKTASSTKMLNSLWMSEFWKQPIHTNMWNFGTMWNFLWAINIFDEIETTARLSSPQ